MNNKSSFLNAQKVKKFKLENEIKHPVLIKNLRITRNILKIVGTVVLCTGITATVLDNSHIYPFYFQEIKVPEYKQTVYTDTNVSSTYTISNSNTESLILYKYGEWIGTERTITKFTFKINMNVKYLLACLENDFEFTNIKDIIDKEEYKESYHEDAVNSKYVLIQNVKTDNNTTSIQTVGDELVEILEATLIESLFLVSGLSIIRFNKIRKKIKNLIKDKGVLTKQQLLEQLEIVNNNIEIMEGHHER